MFVIIYLSNYAILCLYQKVSDFHTFKALSLKVRIFSKTIYLGNCTIFSSFLPITIKYIYYDFISVDFVLHVHAF